MTAWLALLSMAAVTGGLSARHLSGAPSWLVSALLPPTLFLAALLATEHLGAQGGGASMWQIAFLVGGTVAALVSLCSHLAVRMTRRPRRN